MIRTTILVLILGACGRWGFEDTTNDGGAGIGSDTPVAHLTVQYQGTGSGTVVGPQGFTCTAGTCVEDVAPGASVTLRGLAATNSWFSGWTGACGGNFDCTLQVTTDMTIMAEFEPTPNRMFMTSTTVQGNFGGIAAADAICAARATAAHLTGNFVSFVSDSTTTATTRLGSSRGWVRVDGEIYADAATAFGDGKIIYPPRLDEFGNDLGAVQFFTGTNYGTPTTGNCVNWTSNNGTDQGGASSSERASESLGGYNTDCSTIAHLLCVETGRTVPVALHPDTGKLAFATTAKWASGGGRSSADALCTSEAMAAGFTGTFLAAVATTTESVKSRFTAGQVYKRVDGVRLLHTGDLFTADYFDVPPELDRFGGFVDDDFWSGAERLDVVPAATDNCNDWADGTMAVQGIMQQTGRTDQRTPAKNDSCDSAVAMVCLEN